MNNIEFHKITKRFGKLRALDGVSLEVLPGETVLLAGPNGAGKSTLINILLGLYLPDGGEIRINGSRVPVDKALKSRMGYLPENVAFSENLSGWSMMAFFARARGVKKQRMREVFDRIGLSPHAKRSISGYSKGMRQRLALGISILHEPDILILDEPTSGLDQEGLGVLWAVMEEWKEKQRMILISSHDLGLLEKRVDKFCIIRSGHLIASDGPLALRDKAALPIKVYFSLNGEDADHQPLLDRLRERFSVHEHEDTSIQINVASDEIVTLMDTVFASDSPDRAAIHSLRVMEPELEHIYEHLLESS
ncbi:MAG: ABC transporter ATP-binding protein [Verrucomicrobiae bacterium]|nr:ABC transporter ATP-binding protein [Verrucomicrobiae bacterium]NNJ41814.1 ABC transporter ATP-binding protein [Akkermansiaceae bacterium]